MSNSIDRLKDYVVRDMNMIPPFMNTRSINHRNCNEINKLIFGSFYLLIQERVLSKNRVLSLTKVVNNYFIDMFEIDNNISILYFDWYKDILTGYTLYCIDKELWEICANIRNLYEILYDEKMYLEIE